MPRRDSPQANWPFMLLALLLALVAWYNVSAKDRVEIWLEAPLELSNLPTGLEIRQGMVGKVQIRVRGPKSLVRSLEGRHLAYPLDLSGLKSGLNIVSLDPSRIPLHRLLSVEEMSPDKLDVLADAVESKQVPVKARHKGAVSEDHVLTGVRVEPEFVTVSGPKTLVGQLASLSTEEVDFGRSNLSGFGIEAQLAAPNGVRVSPGKVWVEVSFGVRRDERWITVPLSVAGGPSRAKVSPREVRLKLAGPAFLLRDEEVAASVKATLQLNDTLEKGKHDLAYAVAAPADLQVLEKSPDLVKVVVPAPPRGAKAKSGK